MYNEYGYMGRSRLYKGRETLKGIGTLALIVATFIIAIIAIGQ